MHKHDTIIISHTYNHAPDIIFSAFTKKEFMQIWASPAEGILADIKEFNFTENGKIITQMQGDEAGIWTNTDTIVKIITNEIIVQNTTLYLGDELNFSGVCTLDFKQTKSGCELIVTESGAYFDIECGADMHIAGWTAMITNIETILNQMN